jgi:hypothetical protein
MGELEGKRGLSRRDLIKRSAVVGGVAWAAPTILSSLSSPAAAGVNGCCSGPNVFRLKSGDGCATTPTCSTGVGVNDCLTTFGANCCLFSNGVTLSCTATTHTWTLAAGIQFCEGAAKVGEACALGSCLTGPANVSHTHNANGTTTVTITGSAGAGCGLSHSEIVVCAPTRPAGC